MSLGGRYTADEQKLILRVTATHPRDHAIISMALGTGLRIGELLGLNLGDVFAPANHSEAAAALLQPYVDERTEWIVRHHGVFQGYYFWHHIGLDRNAREAFEGHEHYGRTEEFCRLFDMPAFDPDRTTPPLEYFTDAVAEVFAPPPFG